MAGVSRQKQKLLRMEQLFRQRTDAEHPLTGNQLIAILESEGIKAERKTIYDDIATLCDSGLELETVKVGHSNAYYLENRTFLDEELFILVDAVASCKFLTIKKSKELITKLQGLTSEYKAKGLKRLVYVENRVKANNDSIYYIVNTIQNAMEQGKDISFKYTTFDKSKKKIFRHGGRPYQVSPYELVWDKDFYYLTCYYDGDGDKIRHFRVDRMKEVVMLTDKRHELTKEEEVKVKDRSSIFSMYGGEKKKITLAFDAKHMNSMVDRFGENRFKVKDYGIPGWVYTELEVQISPTFWAWLFQFKDSVRIIEPKEVVFEEKEYLESILGALK